MWRSGIDEAGYGPTLGPLAIVRVSAEVPDWDTFSTALLALGAKDSKALHKSGDLAPLEEVALPALRWFSGFTPDTAADVFALLGEDEAVRAAAPWMSGARELRLPQAASGLSPWSLPGKARGLAGALVQPRAYNTWLRSGRNKAELELDRVGRLLQGCHAPDRPQATVVDRLGGRKFYADLIARSLGMPVETLREEPLASVYRRDLHEIGFHVGGESQSPLTAAASCIAKYARELHMLLLNRWWCARLPWLKATAGYPEDAKRWLHQIGEGHVNAFGDDLVRGFRRTMPEDNHGPAIS